MRDWNDDGEIDEFDDVYYMENVDPYYNDSSNNLDLDVDDDFDD